MTTTDNPLPITVSVTVNTSAATCWKLWTTPADILQFNNPFPDWHTAKVDIDLKEGGRLFYRMEAKEGSTGFDFAGIYTRLIPAQLIEYTGTDGRKAINRFTAAGNTTIVTEIFEPDAATPLDLRSFCQHILDSFKIYAEQPIK